MRGRNPSPQSIPPLPARSRVLGRDRTVPGVRQNGPGQLDAQRLFEDLLDILHRHEREFAPHIFGHVFEVPLVLFGQDHLPDPRPVCGKDLLLDPPDRRCTPLRVISPVMARCGSAVFPVIRDASAEKSVTPADGPSSGVAPEGTWMWMSLVVKLNPLCVFRGSG